MTMKVGPSTVEVRGLDASTEGEFAWSEDERIVEHLHAIAVATLLYKASGVRVRTLHN
jgi:hypothetical protein